MPNPCARCGRETHAAAPMRTLCLRCVAADRAAWITGRAAPVHAARPGANAVFLSAAAAARPPRKGGGDDAA